MPYDSQAIVVLIGTALTCGTGIWLWCLARRSVEARIIIVVLWMIGLVMSMITGGIFLLVMGSATVMMGLFICVYMYWGNIGRRWP